MNMIFDLALVEDHGTFWNVVTTTKNAVSNIINTNDRYLRLSFVAYKMIVDALASGKRVHISKPLQFDEVMPHEVIVVDSSADHNPLASAKHSALVSVRILVNPEFNRLAGMTLYSFMVLNNDLINAGYVITNKNREEQYLSILETGDENLVQQLEEYLNARDEIERVSYLERRFTAYRKSVEAAKTVEEVEQLKSAFLEYFYSTLA
jgi:cellulose biosynthesis protein BcsQ